MEKSKMSEIEKNEKSLDTNVEISGCLGTRHWQCLLFFFGITIAYTNRICMSMAIVAIKEEVDKSGTSDLPSESVGMILSSFFWGYTLMQVPSGYLGRVWSAKQVLAWGILINGLSSLLVPTANDYGGWMVMCFCRVVMGLSQACLLPCVHTLLSKWVPPNERGRLGSFTYAGAQFGTVISYPISGALVEAAGWRSVFYFFGSAAIIWSIIFFVFGSDSPIMSSTRSFAGISKSEKDYIESSLGIIQDEKAPPKNPLQTPWIEIFTSVPFWALAMAHCGQNWGFWMLLTEMPTYMDSVLGFNYKENGLKSALPYLAMLLLTMPVSWLSDWSQKKKLSRGLARKISNTLGHWGPALALLGLCFVPQGDTTLPLMILIIAVGLNVGTLCGFQINHIDLSPNFAGLLMSITNCLASVVAILAPIIVGYIVTDGSNVSQWRTVFFMTTGIYFIGNLIFILFGSGEVQNWDDPKGGRNVKHKGTVLSQTFSSITIKPTPH